MGTHASRPGVTQVSDADPNDYRRVLEQWARLEVTDAQHIGPWTPPCLMFLTGVSFSKPVVVKSVIVVHRVIALSEDDPIMSIPAKQMPYPISRLAVTDVSFARTAFIPGHPVWVHLAKPESVVVTLKYELVPT